MASHNKTISILCAVVASWVCCAAVHASGVDEGTSASAKKPAPVSSAAEPTREVVALAEIKRRQAELDDLKDLPPEARTLIAEQYATAIERLETAAQFTAQLQSLEAEATRAPEEIARREERVAAPTPANSETPAIPEKAELLRAAHLEAETAAAEAKKRLLAVAAEIERRTTRCRELPDAIADIRSRLDSIAESLAAPPPTGELPEVTSARRLRLEASRQRRLAELAVLEQEGRTYAATDRVLALDREQAEKVAHATSKHLATLAGAMAAREQRDAEARAAEARAAAIVAHPVVRAAAGVNTDLAEKLAKLVEDGKETKLELERIETLRSDLRQQYAETREQAEKAKFSPAIGLLLRSQQADLPDTSRYRMRASARESRQAEINLDLLQWETERRKLQDTDSMVDGYLEGVQTKMTMAERRDVTQELADVFRARLAIYADLVTNARSMLGRLASLQSADDGLVEVVEEQQTFIAEHVLWVRSTAPISPALVPLFVTAVRDLGNPTVWSETFLALVNDVMNQPLLVLTLAPALWLIVLRRRLGAKLETLAHEARRSTANGFRPTLEAIVVSAALAFPLPGMTLFLGWRLLAIGTGHDIAHAAGVAMTAGAMALAAVNLAIVACLPNGLCVVHFGWDGKATAALRRCLDIARGTVLPAAVTVLFTEASGDELLTGTVGRIALVTEMFCLAVVTRRLFKKSGPVQAIMTRHHPGAWLQILDRFVSRLFVAFPIACAGLSLAGYHYTAVRLSWRLFATWGVIGAGVFVGSLVMRWLGIVHDRLTLRRARERRADMAARQDSSRETPPAHAPTDDRSLELRLSDIEAQSQKLARVAIIATACVCLAMIWHDIVPAVGYLNRFTLWQTGIASGEETGELVRITLVEVLLAIVGATMTVLACRNLPGLLDLAVFQRLPLDAGARYAATAVTQYVVAAIGVILCFRQIGIGWQSVQWLVAAMTVGLGFGLQEIFANFVSGLILLFERPIRVGDVVTIGEVTGTVTRIRIRATTVCDWDCKELIVPNREFVTGKLVNWTLTDPTLRVVIRVGIAYGSDTRLASRLLEDIAKSHPLVLADPSPTVVFTQFGENSLDFELRAFTSGIVNTRVLRHELHMAIDDSFRASGIDIAFPQRELHVKGLPAHWHEPPLETSSPPATSTPATKRHVA